MQTVLLDKDPASSILDACLDEWTLHAHQSLMPADDNAPSAYFNSRYDILNFGRMTWKSVRRFSCLPQAKTMGPGWSNSGISRVRPEVENRELLGDDLLNRTVEYPFFEKFSCTVYPRLPVPGQIKQDLDQARVALGACRVAAKWSMVLILGTRR